MGNAGRYGRTPETEPFVCRVLYCRVKSLVVPETVSALRMFVTLAYVRNLRGRASLDWPERHRDARLMR